MQKGIAFIVGILRHPAPLAITEEAEIRTLHGRGPKEGRGLRSEEFPLGGRNALSGQFFVFSEQAAKFTFLGQLDHGCGVRADR